MKDQCERLEMRIREELIAAGVGPTGRVSLKAVVCFKVSNCSVYVYAGVFCAAHSTSPCCTMEIGHERTRYCVWFNKNEPPDLGVNWPQ